MSLERDREELGRALRELEQVLEAQLRPPLERLVALLSRVVRW